MATLAPKAERTGSDGAAQQRSLFAVPSMHCAGCIGKIERGLKDVDGIAAARVNFSAKQVVIDHDRSLNDHDLQQVIARIGFAAEPLTDLATDMDGEESRKLLRALAVAGFAAMNVMLLSVSIWSGAGGATRQLFHWLSALIAIPAIAYSGQTFFLSAWTALRHGRTNMDVPISIGVLLTTGMSLFETVSGGHNAWFDGAIMLLFFLLAGRWLDAAMRSKARDGVTALLKQTAPGALVVGANGATQWVKAAMLQPGDIILVATGERLAADGKVVAGSGAVDNAFLTGESAPQPVSLDEMVHAGALNMGDPITVRVTAAGAQTLIADISRMMDAASQNKSRYVRIADRAARLYAPAVHTLAALAFAGWWLAGAGVHQALLIATAVLLITCPCALGLAVPASQIVACGALMRRGVLVRDGSALERLSEATIAIFDKTGTLTLGRPDVSGLELLAPRDRAIVRALAGASRHPLSIAIHRALQEEDLPPVSLNDVTEMPGMGINATADGKPVSLCRPTEVPAHFASASEYRGPDGQSILLGFEDRLRPDAFEAVAQVKALGLKAMVASGDRPQALQPVAKAVDLPATGGMLPQEKLALIQQLQDSGEKVLMVGDGLNDGPALAAGHVSMAPSSASDVSQLTADAVFMGDGLMPVPAAIGTARRTMAVIRQNFALAVGYNVLAVPLAIAGLVTPLIAAIAMSLSSLIVVGNALRLRSTAK